MPWVVDLMSLSKPFAKGPSSYKTNTILEDSVHLIHTNVYMQVKRVQKVKILTHTNATFRN